MTAVHETKWFLPLFSVALGLVFLGALWTGGDRRGGLEALAVMVATGFLVLAGGRSELIRGLRGDGRDAYWQRIDIHATVLAGNVAIGAIIGMCRVGVGAWPGRDPYAQLGAITGVAYILAVGALRWRS